MVSGQLDKSAFGHQEFHDRQNPNPAIHAETGRIWSEMSRSCWNMSQSIHSAMRGFASIGGLEFGYGQGIVGVAVPSAPEARR